MTTAATAIIVIFLFRDIFLKEFIIPARTPLASASWFMPKFLRVLSDINEAIAGLRAIESSHDTITPKATKIPKTCTGGIGVSVKERKPATVVNEVNNIGIKRVLMEFLMLVFLCLCFP